MKILITGGAGFIGRHLARLLAASGHAVTAMDTMLPQVHQDVDGDRAAFPGGLIEADVAESGSWDDLPVHDAIVHLAAETGTAQSMYEQDRYRRVNVRGTKLAAETAVSWGAPIVFLSSRAVYGEGRRLDFPRPSLPGIFDTGPDGTLRPSHEEDAHAPLSVYGESKSEAENALRGVVLGRVPSVVLRPQNVIGPGQALHNPYTGVLAAFVAMLKEGADLTVYGDGTQTRDFVHVEDVARLIMWNLDNLPGVLEDPRVLNCGTGVRTTLDDVARYCIDAAPGVETEIKHVDIKRAGDIDHACADLRHVLRTGAPMPMWTTEDAIADFVRDSWDKQGAAVSAWSTALSELTSRGLTE
ncbi:NAD-dependent epimerase/dehydratase family protein [Sinomonas flava]|uniref:UDP-glucose 4-epimerase n=1 Tax=Sinomonas flava TaxID=496857 RepID=A0ABN3BNY7_9MICC